MGAAIEVIDTFLTAGGAGGFAATTPYTDSVLAVRDFKDPAAAWLAAMWANEATATKVRIRSPRLHDNVQGISCGTVAGSCRDLLSIYALQRVYPSDTLIAEISPAAAETDGLSWLVYYDDMPGVAANVYPFSAIEPRIANLVNVEVDLAAPTGVGVRTASVALNGTVDLLKSDTEYALLGYECEHEGLSIGIRGPDTGNLRVGGPHTTEKLETRDWFVRLSEKLGKSCIVGIHANNKTGTLIDATYNGAGTAEVVNLVMAELTP